MRCLISLGSNVDDKECKMTQAVELLSKEVRILKCSSFYLTPALGGGKAPYLNAVAEIETDMDVERLNSGLKHMELSMGRDEESRKRGDVPIDLDVVEADGVVIRERDRRQSYFLIGLNEISCDSHSCVQLRQP